MYKPLFIHPSVDEHLGGSISSYCEHHSNEHGRQASLQQVTKSAGYTPRGSIARLHGSSISWFLRHLRTDFQSDCH